MLLERIILGGIIKVSTKNKSYDSKNITLISVVKVCPYTIELYLPRSRWPC